MTTINSIIIIMNYSFYWKTEFLEYNAFGECEQDQDFNNILLNRRESR